MTPIGTSKSIGQCAIWLLACTTFILIPNELIIVEGAHAFFKPLLGGFYPVVQPFTALLILVCIAGRVAARAIHCDKPLRYSLVVFGLPVLFHLVVASTTYSVYFFWFALLGLVSGLVISRSCLFELFVKYTLFGLSLWALSCILVYAYDLNALLSNFHWMQDYSLGQLIVAVRSPGENFPFRIFYPDIVGNWNKAANVIVLGMLIAVYSIAANRRQSGQAHIALSLLSILLFLSFSRGAMVVITILLIPLWYVFILRAEHFKAVKPRLALSIIAAPVLLSLALPDMRSHWLQLGSMQSRVEQWNRVVAASASTSSSYLDMVFGGGAGSYGMETSGSAASGTHNLFLDTYLWGGALGLTGLTLLLVAYPGVMFSRTLLSGGQFSVRQITGLLGVVAIFTLGMREFDLSYLHVTAIPAILTGLFIGLTGDDGKKPRDLPLSWPVRSRAT